MSRRAWTTERQAQARPYAATCQYDTGSMYECAPACSRPATMRLIYEVPCYGWSTVDVCRWHMSPMRARLYPYRIKEQPIPGRGGAR